MIDRQHIQDTIKRYVQAYPWEGTLLLRLQNRLSAEGDLISRKSFLGHITCGAVVLNEFGQVLTIHHRALDRWLLPGGHIEETDDTLLDAAKREVEEEVGIQSDLLEGVNNNGSSIPVDIDYHPIPENVLKKEPAHYHWDFRFLFLVTTSRTKQQLEEIKGLEWTSLDMLDERLAAKVRKLAAPR
jgi:8-oxo-dGTP pyrophosphatase MutT (NUDIX family)